MIADTPTRMMYRAEHGTDAPGGSAICWLCGSPCPEDGPAATAVIRDTFADAARCRQGGASAVCCAACDWYMSFRILRPGQGRAMGLFTKAVRIWRDRWEEWPRQVMADDLLSYLRDGVPGDVILAANYSKQRHVVPWSHINRAGSRTPWVDTDVAPVRIAPVFADLLRFASALWMRGYPKTGLLAGQLGSYTLARSQDAAGDLALIHPLVPYARTPLMELALYCITEENRHGLAGDCAPVLGGDESAAATRGTPAVPAAPGSGPGVQEPIRSPVVANAGGPRSPLRDDQQHTLALE